MDRLSALARAGRALPVAVTLAALAACDSGAPPSTQQRVVAVTSDRVETPDLASFCDVVGAASSARALELPPLDRQPAAAPAGSWRWINVWATWCRPCVEEMPMILDWHQRLPERGTTPPLALQFLSVDETPDAIATFRRDHPRTPETLRLSDPAALAGWLGQLGLDPGATLPIQIFVDPEGRVRCVRSGAVEEAHFETIARMLSMP
jgi:thiol-disulfide isomerase/thioredoxin